MGQTCDVDAHCCFCQEIVQDADDGTVALIVVTAKRRHEEHPPTQALFCHSTCMGSRLAPNVPFLFVE